MGPFSDSFDNHSLVPSVYGIYRGPNKAENMVRTMLLPREILEILACFL